jgi:hypothetical protein
VVATDGVDGAACTLEAPCATLAHVAGRMSAGHTLYLRAGTYAQRLDSLTAPIPGGMSWDTPTTIAAYGQEIVTLDMTSFILAWFRNPATDHYLILDRLIFEGSSPPSTETTGMVFEEGTHHIRVQNSRFQNMRFYHVMVNGGDHIQLLNNTFTDNVEVSSVALQGNVDSLVIQGNTFANSAEHGILTLEAPAVTNAQLTRNVFQGMGGAGLVLGEGSVGTLVANNLVHSSTTGVQVGTLAQGTKVYNNTLADNTGTGLQIDTGATGTLVTNTLVYGNGSGIVNNGTGTVLTTNLTTDPGFVGGGSYKIASGTSPAVDTGTDLAEVPTDLEGMMRPAGATDIGAYDRAATPPPVTPGSLRALPYQTGQLLVLP